MKNLARREYDHDVDTQVKTELQIANIPVFDLPSYMNTEVKTYYIGILNGFVFYRAWTYWICEGYMPLNHAVNIYNKYADLDIRTNGMAGNEKPCINNAYDPVYDEEIDKLYIKYDHDIKKVEKEVKAQNIHKKCSDPLFINTYHIDTQLGLCKLARYIKDNNITTKMIHLKED